MKTIILLLFVFALFTKDINAVKAKTQKSVNKNDGSSEITHKSEFKEIVSDLEESILKTGSFPQLSFEQYQKACKRILMPVRYEGLGCTKKVDPLGYYVNTNDCVHHFMNVYPAESFDESLKTGNSSACRIFYMVALGKAIDNIEGFVPTYHCKYVGKTGGSKCKDEYVFGHNDGKWRRS